MCVRREERSPGRSAISRSVRSFTDVIFWGGGGGGGGDRLRGKGERGLKRVSFWWMIILMMQLRNVLLGTVR